MPTFMRITLSLAASAFVLIAALFAILLVFNVISWSYTIDFMAKTLLVLLVISATSIILGFLTRTSGK